MIVISCLSLLTPERGLPKILLWLWLFHSEGFAGVQQLPSRSLGQSVMGLLLPNFYPFLQQMSQVPCYILQEYWLSSSATICWRHLPEGWLPSQQPPLSGLWWLGSLTASSSWMSSTTGSRSSSCSVYRERSLGALESHHWKGALVRSFWSRVYWLLMEHLSALDIFLVKVSFRNPLVGLVTCDRNTVLCWGFFVQQGRGSLRSIYSAHETVWPLLVVF